MPDQTEHAPPEALRAAADAFDAAHARTLDLGQITALIADAVWRLAVAEGRRQATEGFEPLRAAADGVKHLNRPMLDALRWCAADTSPNWDVRATVYPPSARDLVALIDALLAAVEQDGDDRG